MLRRVSNASSTSSRLSREDDAVRRPPSGLLSKKPLQKRPGSALTGSNRFSRSSIEKREEYDENKASFYESCRSVYLMVFDDTKEEITSTEELTLLLQYAGHNPTKKMINGIWGDNTDSITFYQFCDILKDGSPMSRDALIKAFRKIDVNHDGYITHDELLNVLTMHGERMTKSEVRTLMDDSDYNGDGKLDYKEFCDMMLATARRCSDLSGYSKKKEKSLKEKEKDRKASIVSKKKSFREDPKKSEVMEERPPSRPSSAKKLSKKGKDTGKHSDDSDHNVLEASASRTIKEPSDLTKWRYRNIKGCFYVEEDGNIESHQYRLVVLEKTDIFVTVKALTPKYGKYSKELSDSDITVFLMEESKGGKLVAFTETEIEQKYCLRANVEAGTYQLLTFTSGVLLSQHREAPDSPAKLVIGEGEDAKFTKVCKETLYEIFYRCDLDGNGFLNRQEFNQFQMKTSGEGVDDDAWDVVKEEFEMNNKEEITPDGFLKLNLMEAQDPDGGTDELWVTIESMGYNKALELVKAFPFQIEVFTRKGDSALEPLGVSGGGKPLQKCINESIKTTSRQRPFKDNKNIVLHISENIVRTTLAVENKTYVPLRIRLRCNESRNILSKQDSLDFVCNLDSKETQIVDHLVPKKRRQEMKIVCEESILR
eukprot:Seg224.11 transcript_id=Seg224.11/GoldUCD/mRNA.D3Y31 product="EF-hand calcium-binding domain-containing protein 7" protein_id=Seg224.11/GoldUCD/D3Y31